MGLARRQNSERLPIRERAIALVKYDAACRALASAKSVDEASHIRNSATAIRAYAKQAKNRQLEIDAVEIRIRAERRIGELIAAQKKSTGLNQGAIKGKTGFKAKPVLDTRPKLADAGIDKNLSMRAQELAAMPAAEFETVLEDWRERVQEQPKARITTAVHFSSKTAEHYTPREILERVVRCLEAIDLDPCSNSETAPNVPAARHYTADGLEKIWSGRVYMNPPYGREIDNWIEKLCESHEHGDVSEAIALVPARTDTQWFARLRDYVCCFVSGRLTFVGNTAGAPFPSALVYLGDDLGKFYRCFSDVGDIWQRLEPGMFGE